MGIQDNKKILLVLGGSQGSHFINTLCVNLFTEYPDLKNSVQIIHQTGAQNNNELITFYKNNSINAYVFEYLDQLENFYPAADVVICRAGAGTLFETVFFKKKCIVIPLETQSNTHQLDNANALQKHYQKNITILRQHELETTSSALFTALESYLASIPLEQ